jgi:hypothetical protein
MTAKTIKCQHFMTAKCLKCCQIKTALLAQKNEKKKMTAKNDSKNH